jgi:spore germination protein GerM
VSGRPTWRPAAGLAALGLAAIGLVIASCGVPDHGRAQRINAADVPFGLAEPAPTTTTTAPFPPPDSGLLSDGEMTEAVTLYFAQDARFVAVNRAIGPPLTLNAVVDALSQGPLPEDGAEGTRSVIGTGDVEQVTSRAGVATVELGSKFPELPPAEQRLGIAQLVLTLTDRPGIGQVAFAINGQPADVPRADGYLDRGPISRDDYRTLLR